VKTPFRVLGCSRLGVFRWTAGNVKRLLPPRQSRGISYSCLDIAAPSLILGLSRLNRAAIWPAAAARCRSPSSREPAPRSDPSKLSKPLFFRPQNQPHTNHHARLPCSKCRTPLREVLPQINGEKDFAVARTQGPNLSLRSCPPSMDGLERMTGHRSLRKPEMERRPWPNGEVASTTSRAAILAVESRSSPYEVPPPSVSRATRTLIQPRARPTCRGSDRFLP